MAPIWLSAALVVGACSSPNSANRQAAPTAAERSGEGTNVAPSTTIEPSVGPTSPAGKSSSSLLPTEPEGGAASAGNKSTRIDRATALRWWLLRPYLEAKTPAAEKAPVRAYLAKSSRPYAEVDPRKDSASLTSLYLDPGRDWEPGNWKWLAEGGRGVVVTSYPPSVPASLRPNTTPRDRDGSKPVVVRGQAGKLTRVPVDGTELILVVWSGRSDDGIDLVWQVLVSGRHMTEEQAVGWADSLQPGG